MKWLVAALLLLLLAAALGMGLLVYAMYALLAVLLVSRFLSQHWVKNLLAKRRCSHQAAQVGDTVTITIVVENQSSLPAAWVLLEDVLPRKALLHDPPNLQLKGQPVRLEMLPGNAAKTIFYQLQCNRRGYYQLGPTVAETGDFFGLHRRHRILGQPQFLLVYPPVTPLDGFELESPRPLGEIKMTHRLFEDPTRIAGVREYEPGDPLSRIHWAASARTGVLHSKVYDPSCIAGVTILLDFHKDSHAPRNEPMRSELAVRAAASLANAVYQMGQQIGLVTNGRDAADRIRQEGWKQPVRSRKAARKAMTMAEKNERLQPIITPTRRGPEQFMQIWETLARIELTDGLPLPELIRETLSRIPRDATVAVILPKVDESDAIALGELRRRGYAVTAFLNLYDNYDFAQASGALLAQGVAVQHLRDEESIAWMCRDFIKG